MKIAGVVLAGGRSRRMGRTKALIEIDGRPMADHVIGALRSAGCDPVVVMGGDPGELAVLDAPVLTDPYPRAGPVGGILAALRMVDEWYGPDRADAVIVLACDLPAIDGTVLGPLIDVVRPSGHRRRTVANDRDTDPRIEAVVARTDRLEPMCALWMLSALPVVEQAFADGERALHRLLSALRTAEVDVPSGPLVNVNTPDDL